MFGDNVLEEKAEIGPPTNADARKMDKVPLSEAAVFWKLPLHLCWNLISFFNQ